MKKMLFWGLILLFGIQCVQPIAAEANFTTSMLGFLYQNRIGKTVRSLFTGNRYFSGLVGWCANRSLSSYAINPFIKKYEINIDEAEPSDISKYSSFNEFFIRKLKDGSRPIDQDQNSIISPADGQLYVIQNLNTNTEFLVKNKPFNLEKLLGNKSLAQNYLGGTMIVVYLAPHNYHRFHFPIDCTPTQPISINGRYESVNSFVYTSGIQPLTENERHLIMLNHSTLGKIAYIPVGALCVGKIVETFTPSIFAKKGSEAGYFCFGGSTIVMLFEKNTITIDPKFTTSQPTPIKMGERIAKTRVTGWID